MLVFESDIDIGIYEYLGLFISITVLFIMYRYMNRHDNSMSIKEMFRARKFTMVRMKVAYYALSLVLLGVFFDTLTTMYVKNKIQNIIEKREYQSIEGEVKNLHIVRKVSHEPNTFDIDAFHFEIYSFRESFLLSKVLFYPNRKEKMLQNGQSVRIHYITLDDENKIIKMWVLP